MTILQNNSRTARRMGAAALAVLMGLSPAFARQLTVDEAIAAANSSVGMQKAAPAKNYELKYTVKAEKLNTLYVVSDGQGYMVLAADDVATPLLGYSDSGSFDAEMMPPSMKAWLDQYSAQIAYAAAHGAKVHAAAPRANYTSIAPLVSTKWNQDKPYNDMCPKVGNTPTYTGCVATAMAQVVNTYKWPVTGKGTKSYSWNGQTLKLDFSTVTFKWNDLIDDYSGNKGTAAQREAVAELMYACGIAAEMKYGTGASGANGVNASQGLVRYFDYDAALKYCERDYYDLNTWMDMIYAELAAGHPVYYDGTTANNEGHAFVLDGYSANDGLVHINWGWGGMSDGYFQITTLSPDEQGIGGASSGFCYGQGAMIGLKKAVAGSKIAPNLAMSGSMSIADVPNRTTKPRITMNVLPENGGDGAVFSYSLEIIQASVGLKFTSSNGQSTYAWSNSYTYQPLTGLRAYEMATTNFPTTNGTYTVTPVFSSNDEIYELPVKIGCTKALTLTVDGNKLSFKAVSNNYELKATDIKPARQMYTGKAAAVTATITNTGDEYFSLISAKIMKGSTTVATFDGVMTDVVNGMLAEVTIGGKLPTTATPGKDYQIIILDATGNEIGHSGNVEIQAAPTGAPVLTVTNMAFPNSLGGNGDKATPYRLASDNAQFSLNLNCTAGYFDTGYITFEFYKSAFDRPSINIAADIMTPGETQKISFIASLDALKQGVVYELRIKNGGTVIYKTNITPVDPAGIDDVTVDGGTLNVYPNPATDVVTIEAGAGIKAVNIYSLDGSLVRRATFDGSNATESADVDGIAAGHYIITVETAAGTAAQRLIKR